jgi:hypothetical protein
LEISGFQWKLDVLSGKVTNVSHDITDLQRYTAVKNLWEETISGREERAIAATVYNKVANIFLKNYKCI